MGVVPLYGWLASRVPRVRLIAITSVFFALNLGLFSLAGRAGLRIGVAFYIWLGIFNVFVPAQFWAFANDLYTEGQGRAALRAHRRRRLARRVGRRVGGDAAAQAGGLHAVDADVRQRRILLVALAVTIFVNRRETARTEPEARKINEAPLGRQGGFELVLKDRYLPWIALLIVLLNVVEHHRQNSCLSSVVTAEAASPRRHRARGTRKPPRELHRRLLRHPSSRRPICSASCCSSSSPRA